MFRITIYNSVMFVSVGFLFFVGGTRPKNNNQPVSEQQNKSEANQDGQLDKEKTNQSTIVQETFDYPRYKRNNRKFTLSDWFFKFHLNVEDYIIPYGCCKVTFSYDQKDDYIRKKIRACKDHIAICEYIHNQPPNRREPSINDKGFFERSLM
ncbi:hypothetical protein M153_220000934 [Pseudoloma neurophilia]|uniref:Uncharacterized protein n=1 Tax=Pseudoloma neurophilia TaxID=146866 RepID=A0A0R0M4T0_9MICR|nr:hypothetical protein M153_220000934 [Pseudoloma neurophilia]